MTPLQNLNIYNDSGMKTMTKHVILKKIEYAGAVKFYLSIQNFFLRNQRR